MSSRGVFQLRRVYIQFCDWGGSSAGIREFIQSDNMKQFMKENPQIDFEFYERRNRHPYLSATYINGFIKDVPLLNKKDEGILETLNRVRNSSGRKPYPHSGKRVYGTQKSVQGEWHETLWNNTGFVELEKLRGPKKPEIKFELIDRETNKSQFVYHSDIVSKLINSQEKKWDKGEHL